METKHILHSFEDALNLLRDNILMMGSLTERNLSNATRGLLQRDEEACNSAIVDDEEIDYLEKLVDSDGLTLIARFQPVAGDLRAVVSAMRISSNLERIADQATAIARRARKLNRSPKLDQVVLLEPLLQKTITLFRDCLRAFSDRDVALARSLKARDREVDLLNNDAASFLTDAAASHVDQIELFLHLIFIARNLERVGDHATNIGEDVVFAEVAEDIRHDHPSREIHEPGKS